MFSIKDAEPQRGAESFGATETETAPSRAAKKIAEMLCSQLDLAGKQALKRNPTKLQEITNTLKPYLDFFRSDAFTNGLSTALTSYDAALLQSIDTDAATFLEKKTEISRVGIFIDSLKELFAPGAFTVTKALRDWAPTLLTKSEETYGQFGGFNKNEFRAKLETVASQEAPNFEALADKLIPVLMKSLEKTKPNSR